MNRVGSPSLLVASLIAFCGWSNAGAPETNSSPVSAEAAAEFFETKVRPVFAEHCASCHGPKKQNGGLRVDSRDALILGGDTGSAIIPGKPDESLLVDAIRYGDTYQMPPKGRLRDDQVAAITQWVSMGAPWPQPTVPAPQPSLSAFSIHERARHWAFQPLAAPAPPTVKRGDWPKSPIDYFLLHRLEAAGLSPANPADKRTLIRRATFDLIGLPPTPAEIDAFLEDKSPDAFAKVVDRLLASPRYGERWGRHWLDLVRYAETAGHEFDLEIPNAFEYRDYVIRAFNSDLPYNQFVKEHIAGDLLPNPRIHPTRKSNESIVATGFFFLGESKHSPVDLRQDQSDRMDNQIDVMCKTFEGLTVACARCHDHKFDAVSTRDYYALAGFLKSSRYQEAFIDAPDATREAIRQIEETRTAAQPMAIDAVVKAQRSRLDELRSYLMASAEVMRAEHQHPNNANAVAVAEAAKKYSIEEGRLKQWVKHLGSIRNDDNDLFYPWVALGVPSVPDEEFSGQQAKLVRRLRERSAAAQAQRSDKDLGELYEDFQGSRYKNWTVSGEAFGGGPTQTVQVLMRSDRPEQPVRTTIETGVAHSGLVSDRLEGVLRSPTFTISKRKILYHMAGKKARVNLIVDGFIRIREPLYGGFTIPANTGDQMAWRVQNVAKWIGHRAHIEIVDDGEGFIAVDQIRFADDSETAARLERLSHAPNRHLADRLEQRSIKNARELATLYRDLFIETVQQLSTNRFESSADWTERLKLVNWLLNTDLLPERPIGPSVVEPGRWAELNAFAARLTDLEQNIPKARRAIALADGTGEDQRVQIRGNPNKLGESVSRRFLTAIAGEEQSTAADGSGRLQLAEQMVAPSNALLPRVMVNRVWQHHFGEGIVRTPDDFGAMGQLPTHPDLLDYLATEFIKQGWSMKAMHRLMMLSSTYQMQSVSDGRADQVDPTNKLLHRMPIRRLEAEAIRDAVLAVSGRLDTTMEGPSVPTHLTEFMEGRGRPAVSGPLDGNGRRSVYQEVRRNFLAPIFVAFDYPTPFSTMGRRGVSNVPAQALTMMNNGFVIQQAEVWAKRILAEPDASTAERITKMYLSAYGRTPTVVELTSALDFVEDQTVQYGKEDAEKAWRDLCHVLMNVKEFIFVN